MMIPRAEALRDEEWRCWQEMVGTPPQTAAGLALMLATFLYRVEAQTTGAHFHDPESWYSAGLAGEGTLYLMLSALWRSPAAAELFGLVPADDPAICQARRERSREAFEKALSEAKARPYGPSWDEVQGAKVAAEALGKPISDAEAVAMLKAAGPIV